MTYSETVLETRVRQYNATHPVTEPTPEAQATPPAFEQVAVSLAATIAELRNAADQVARPHYPIAV